MIALVDNRRETNKDAQRVRGRFQVTHLPRGRLVIRILHHHSGPAYVFEAKAGARVADRPREEQHETVADTHAVSEPKRFGTSVGKEGRRFPV